MAKRDAPTQFEVTFRLMPANNGSYGKIVDRKVGSYSQQTSCLDTEFAGFPGVMSALENLVKGKIDAKDFETGCRKIVGEDAFFIVAIPRLVEKCADALVKVVEEDFLETLYHCSQLKLKVGNQTLKNTFP